MGANRRDGQVRARPGSVASVCSNGPGPPRPETVAAKLDGHVRHHPGHMGSPYKRMIAPTRTRSG